MVLYVIVRICVYMLALLLTFALLPGIHMDLTRTIPAEELAKASPQELAALEVILPWLPFLRCTIAIGFWFWNTISGP